MLKITLILIFQIYSNQVNARSYDHTMTYIKLEKLKYSIESYLIDCPHLASQFNSWNQLLKPQSTCWNGPYLKPTDIKDSFNNIFIIEHKSPSNITLVSKGIDKILNTKDDIRSSDNTEKRRNIACYYMTRNKHFIKQVFCQFPISTIFIILIVFLLIGSNIKRK